MRSSGPWAYSQRIGNLVVTQISPVAEHDACALIDRERGDRVQDASARSVVNDLLTGDDESISPLLALATAAPLIHAVDHATAKICGRVSDPSDRSI